MAKNLQIGDLVVLNPKGLPTKNGSLDKGSFGIVIATFEILNGADVSVDGRMRFVNLDLLEKVCDTREKN